MKEDLKSNLYLHCAQYAEQRVTSLEEALQSAQSAANSETKSTAGDKHETGRAMMQLESERLSAQVSEAQRIREELQRIQPKSGGPVVSTGSVVKTTKGNYFIAIAAGKTELENEWYFAISPSAPIAQALKGHKAGDEIVFQGSSVTIREVF